MTLQFYDVKIKMYKCIFSLFFGILLVYDNILMPCKGDYMLHSKRNKGGIFMTTINRYCSIQESIKQSCQEIKQIRSGKIAKISWNDFVSKQKKNDKKTGE